MKNIIKYTPKQEKEICNEYKNKIKTIDICNKYKFSPVKLYSILNKYKIQYHGAIKTPSDIINKLINLLNQNESLKQACKILNISKSNANKYLKIRNYKVKPKGQFKRKYTLNENFLDNINTKEKAQLMGILFSDGTISKRNKLISLRLQEDDIEYLEKIKLLINSNKPITIISGRRFISPLNKKTYQGKNTAILDITSKIFYYNALKAGILPRKTWLNLGIPTSIIENLKKYFILGVFEGDGCLTWNEKYKTVCLSFAGSDSLTKDILNFIKKELNIKGKIKPHHSIFILEYKKYEDVKTIINWIYDGCSFYMKRKFDKKELFLNYLSNK